MPIYLTPAAKKYLSNKPDTTLKTPELGNLVKVSKVFIDKISLVMNLPAGEEAHDIYTAVMEQLDADDLFVNMPGGKSGVYQIAKRIKLESVVDFKRLPLIQFKYSKSDKVMTSIRLEFVPVDLGPVGVEELKIAVTSFMDGWQYMLDHAHITRIDISVDLDGVCMESFLFMPKQAAVTTQWQFDGKLQSYYMGKKDGNQWKVYDRKAKRLAKGQVWSGPPSVRIERKLTKLSKLTLPGLLLLSNPFDGIKLLHNVVTTPPSIPDSKKYVWTLFTDAVKVRGMTDALALLPDDLRAKYRKHIKSQNMNWWDPEALWEQWPKMLDDLCLLKG